MDTTQIFKSIENLQVLVIGDAMLDKYLWGDAERISPEAPVQIVGVKKEEIKLGGAANVALNCKSLGAQVTIASIIGDDYEGNTLRELLNQEHINTQLLLNSKSRYTTIKTRILARNQQMLRFDKETIEELNTEEEHTFIDAVLRFLQIHKPNVVIFEDYNKGILKENVINRIIEHCKVLQIITAVDPKKANFFAYKNTDIFKPNLKEALEALNIELPEVSEAQLQSVHATLHNQLQHNISLITLSEKGVYAHCDNTSVLVPAHLRNIADVSGAGDTVIAVAALVYAVTKDFQKMATWSNIAGGLVCETVGVCPIDKSVLEKELNRILN